MEKYACSVIIENYSSEAAPKPLCIKNKGCPDEKKKKKNGEDSRGRSWRCHIHELKSGSGKKFTRKGLCKKRQKKF